MLFYITVDKINLYFIIIYDISIIYWKIFDKFALHS